MRYLQPSAVEALPGPPAVVPMEFDVADASLPGEPSYTYINEAGVREDVAADVWRSGVTLDGRPVKDEVASAIANWSRGLNQGSIAAGSLFFRNRFTMTTNVYDQMLQCVAAGQLVLTRRGHVPVEDVRIGDQVLTHRGRWRPVTNKWDNGVRDTVLLRGFGNMIGLQITPDHRLLAREVQRVRPTGKPNELRIRDARWAEARSLAYRRVGGRGTSLWASPGAFPQARVPEARHDCKRGRPANLPDDWASPDFLWLYGLWVAEGSCLRGGGRSYYNTLRWSVHVDERDDVVQRIEGCGLRYRVDPAGRNCVNITVHSRPLTQWMIDNAGLGAAAKRIATWAFGLEPKLREAVLDGYTYGDGSACTRRSAIGSRRTSTISRGLALDVKILGQLCGYQTSIRRGGSARSAEIQGRRIQCRRSYDTLQSTAKDVRARLLDDGLVWSSLAEMVDAGPARVYDLEVAEDHSFVVEGVVVHNCIDAVEFDDVLGSVCDATEGLAFQKITLEMVDQDQEDIWNQIAKRIKLAQVIKLAFRDLYKVSQVYVGVQWRRQTFTVRTPTVPVATGDDDNPDIPVPGAEDLHPSGVPRPGPRGRRKRRKQFTIDAPAALTIWDPTKILPVGQLVFGRERFAYIASLAEHQAFMKVWNGEGVDPLVLQMFDGPYVPSPEELAVLSEQHRGVTNTVYLWLFKKDAIFRHTLTRAHYERFAALRLKSALPLLDMKTHLRASDRAALIGATNFIIVLKRGTEKFPARTGEVEQLREQARVVARMPILVGDHRLSVEIITPKTDYVLDEKKHNVLDARLIMRGLGSFRLGGLSSSRSSGEAAPAEAEIERGIEARRNDLAATFVEHLITATVERNDTLTEEPEISFHPKRVVLSLDPDLMKLIMQLRDRGDISRETELEEFQLAQDVEYVRRKREVGLEPVFNASMLVPHGSPSALPSQSGNAGGRPLGGGGAGADSTPAAGPSAPTQPTR